MEWLGDRQGGNLGTDLLGEKDTLLDGLDREVRPIGRYPDLLEHYSSPPLSASFCREDCRKSRCARRSKRLHASSHSPHSGVGEWHCPDFRHPGQQVRPPPYPHSAIAVTRGSARTGRRAEGSPYAVDQWSNFEIAGHDLRERESSRIIDCVLATAGQSYESRTKDGPGGAWGGHLRPASTPSLIWGKCSGGYR